MWLRSFLSFLSVLVVSTDLGNSTCLASVDFCDEIVVVDSSDFEDGKSIDGTWEKLVELQKNNLPILVGGSSLHLLCVLQNWKKGEKRIRKEIPSNVLTLGVAISRKELKKSVGKNISEMFRKGLYSEFKILYKKSQKGELSEELLKETLGYRQFLEMAKVSNKSPLELNTKDLIKIKKWIIKDILKYAYHQSLDYKKFPNIHLIRGFKQSKKIVDSFLNH